jgi:ATPase subunit of ABC transporter with duplicated ATPase domains
MLPQNVIIERFIMIHHPISITHLGLSFPQKVCFANFSTQVQPGMRIALMGRNGSGKSTLLKMLQGLICPSEGGICVPKDIVFGYVPQVIEDFADLSGGQRLNEALTRALVLNPNVLLLDEPTNHLDLKNRRSLMRLLQKFPGTLIVVSHDVELLRTCIDTLWHIQDEKIAVFSGSYDDYMWEIQSQRISLEKELSLLDRQKRGAHQALMKEQSRAKNSYSKGEKHIEDRKWPTVVSVTKARRSEETSGRKKKGIQTRKQDLVERLSNLRLPESIIPKFSLKSADVSPSKTLISIVDGGCGYGFPLLEGVLLSLNACGRLAITGDNGSGKSTLVKGILNDTVVLKSGEWIVPKPEDIGYLDQHYSTLVSTRTVFEEIQTLAPTWPHEGVRRLLNDFLFRKNEEVLALVSTLSGGEKARLSLAKIAAKTPKLLILDEVTNNLDLETRAHVIQVLNHYPGALIVISHDEEFLKEIGIENFYELKSRKETR